MAQRVPAGSTWRRRKIVILDACRNNPIVNALGARRVRRQPKRRCGARGLANRQGAEVVAYSTAATKSRDATAATAVHSAF